MNLLLTSHARARMQQRAIHPEALECLLEFGREAFDHRGHAVIVYFDKKARSRLERNASGAWREDIGRISRMYAVLSGEGKVLTVGHRDRRINRG